MKITMRRAAFATAAGAAVLAFCLAGPGFAKGGGGGAGGGGGNAGGGTKPAPKKVTVFDDLEKNGDLSTFTAAVKAVGLDKTLSGNGSFTVLAPNNAAFTKIEVKWQDLNKPENKSKMKSLIEAHIVPSKMKSADIAKQTKLTAGGVQHDVKLDADKKPAIDGAKIVKEDVEASNGFVQVLDAVLLPAEKEKPAPPAGK